MHPPSEPITPTFRQLCQQLEQQCSQHIAQLTNETSSSPAQRPKSHLEAVEQLKNSLVSIISGALPAIITQEEEYQEAIETLREEKTEWHDKYRRVFGQYEQNQLHNDQLKVQIVTVSENYEALSAAYEQMKYDYHALKQEQASPRLPPPVELRDTHSASNDSDRSLRNRHEVMAEEKELFLEEIRQTQKELLQHRESIGELIAEKERLLVENEQNLRVLEGEQVRSSTLDREIVSLLNHQQQQQVELIEEKEKTARALSIIDKMRKQVGELEEAVKDLKQQKEHLAIQLTEQQTIISQLRSENSEERAKLDAQAEQQRLNKARVGEMNRQNEEVRRQMERIISQLQQAQSKNRHYQTVEAARHRQELEAVLGEKQRQEQDTKERTSKKMQDIAKMHREMTHKLEQKIRLLEQSNNDKKKKIFNLKFEVERLYEAMEGQVNKEDSTAKIIKELKEQNHRMSRQNGEMERQNSQLVKKLQISIEELEGTKAELSLKEKLINKQKEKVERIRKAVLPRLREQLVSVRIGWQHIASTVKIEQQQISFVCQKKGEQAKQLIEQVQMQNKLSNQQVSLSHEGEIAKWKENCRAYQDKYSQLERQHHELLTTHTQTQQNHAEQLAQKEEQIIQLAAREQRDRLEQASTSKTIQTLTHKCKEIQQYYKLTEELSKENQSLRNKLETSFFSFRSPEGKADLEHTRKGRNCGCVGVSPHNRTAKGRLRGEAELAEVTSKAECQRVRLEGVRREYEMLGGGHC